MSTDRESLGWCVVELMGHRRLAGWVSEQEIGSTVMLRLDVPGNGDQAPVTQLYSTAAVYCITPTTEEIARGVATGSRPVPVSRFELPPLPSAEPEKADEDDDSAWAFEDVRGA